jgi:alpha-tubulin suppressor-like RCC1 family protein
VGAGGNGRTLAPFTVIASGATAVSAGASHTCALVANGNVACWGANDRGQLATGTTITASSPQTSKFTGAVALASGGSTSCIINAVGERWCAGSEFMEGVGE